MNHRSISHWGVFEEPDSEFAVNVFFTGDGGFDKVEDDHPFMLSTAASAAWYRGEKYRIPGYKWMWET